MRRRRKTISFDISMFENKTRRVRECFDAALLRASAPAAGYADPAPIFIVGLPRSGSTLVEQILASHSSVEGTFELPNILTIVREFDHADPQHDAYPENLRDGSRRTVRGARPPLHRGDARRSAADGARFIDKMPNNFSHVGLIHAMLPQATIIDVRRHPMDSCFSTFKQHFAEGQSFSYDLEDLGRYYRCYLGLMDHWDEVLPGKVLHLHYEALVRRSRDPHPPPAGALRAGVRARLPCISRNQAAGAHRERGAGAPAAVRIGRRLLEAFRAAARTAAASARRLPGALRRCESTRPPRQLNVR